MAASESLDRARFLLTGTDGEPNSKVEKKTAPSWWTRNKEIFEFERDYVALILSLASSIKTGREPLDALISCASLFPDTSVIHRELKSLREAIEEGQTEEDAVLHFAKDIAHPDLPLFRGAILLSIKMGGSLAPSLARLAKVTRQRQSFRRRIKTALAQQRLSALGIAGCAVLILGIQCLTNPESFFDAMKDSFGIKAMFTALVLMTGGIAWMFSLSKTRV